MRRALLVVSCGLTLGACGLGGSDAAIWPRDLGGFDGGPGASPILFVHGISGSADNFGTMIGRFTESGWPQGLLFARTFADPSWGCNTDNGKQIAAWVEEIRAITGAERVDLVAHSMGTLSTRYYLERLDGAPRVRTYATLGGMHHGLDYACAPDVSFTPCVWKEICSSGAFIADLNTPPFITAGVRWISIYGTDDSTVPNDSSILDGAENVAVPGASHSGLLDDPPGFDALRGRL